MENYEVELETKLLLEEKKRKEFISEADAIIELIDNHYLDKKKDVEKILYEKDRMIDELHNIVHQRNINKLDEIFERLG